MEEYDNKNYNEIQINRAAKDIFDYVSRPDLWHEWHPASQSAVLPRVPLQAGDEFDEVISMAPVDFLPVKISRHTHYRVTGSTPHTMWEVEGESSGMKLRIHYDLEEQKGGSGPVTNFKRSLSYSVFGALRLAEVLFLRKRITEQSQAALEGLKAKLEG